MQNNSKKFWLYKIVNIINDKVYIGQTIEDNPMMRWYKHNWDANNRCTYVISNAIRKYGKEAFAFEIIAECKNIDDLNFIETELIKQYDTLVINGKGYNVKPGGQNSPHSEETKKKIGDGNRGKTKANKGRPLTQEHKDAVSRGSMGKPGTNKGKIFPK